MPTVAYLANLFPSATERYIVDEIRELRSRGINVIPCSVRRPSAPLDSDLACWLHKAIYLQPLNSIMVLQAAWLCLRNFAQVKRFLSRILFQGTEAFPKRIRALAHTFLGAYYAVALRKFPVQHIHVHHGYFGSWIAMVAARLLHINFSMTLHGSDILLDPAYLDLKLDRCQLCVTISDFNRRHLVDRYPRVDPHKIVVRRLGVNCARNKPFPSSRGRDPSAMAIFSAGRLHRVKNYAFLIRACRELKLRGLNFTCQIAGDGVERSSLEAMIRDFDVQKEVRLLGQISLEQIFGHYEMADLVALTSRSEGIPLVLMEAMARESIVLAPDITGISELVIDGETGFLYRPGSLADFVARVEMIHNRQFELGSVRRAARRDVLARFNREKNLAAFCDRLITNLPRTNFPKSVAKASLMRILFCNKYNFPFSGTEVYLFELMDLLRSHGHEVALFSMADSRGAPSKFDAYFIPHTDFKDLRLPWTTRAKLAAHAIYSTDARKRLRKLLAEFRPDLAHVRNIYHHLSPSILWELKSQGIPVLYHLNDFKILCPAYNLVSHSQVCTQPCTGRYWKVFTNRCYGDSSCAAAVLGAEAYFHHWLGTYRKCVDRFLTPSQFAKDLLIKNGFDPQAISVLPHFQRLPAPPQPPDANAPILYFGRLSAEKGVADLIYAMRALPHLRLQIAGDGPLRADLQRLPKLLDLENIEFLGRLSGGYLDQAIAASCFTVLPSHAYETLGKSILESYAWERPVIASDLGSRRELVHENETGLLYEVGNVEQLGAAILRLAQQPKLCGEMGAAGRRLVEANHTPQQHYEQLMSVYEQITSRSPVRVSKRPAIRVAFIGGRGVISKYSGIETYYEKVGRELASLGYEVTIYCRNYFTPALRAHNGMRLVRLATIRSKHFETPLHTLLSSLHVMFTSNDIVHYHALGSALFSFLPRLLGKKTIVTVQGLDWQRKKWGHLASLVLRLGESAAARFPNATMVVSKTLQDYYRSNHRKQTLYIPNGATLRNRVLPTQLSQWGLESQNYALFLGRFSPEKNCQLLIEAYEKLDTSAKFVLAGGSSHTDAYAAALQRHQSPRVILLDWVAGDALDELLTNAALFVLPSDLEGLSLALLDAMGAGVCVLASDIPENRELVEGVGFTFRPGDVDDLARMLALLFSDPEIRATAARSAQQRTREGYLWPQITRQIAQVYEELLNGRSVTDRNLLPRNASGEANIHSASSHSERVA